MDILVTIVLTALATAGLLNACKGYGLYQARMQLAHNRRNFRHIFGFNAGVHGTEESHVIASRLHEGKRTVEDRRRAMSVQSQLVLSTTGRDQLVKDQLAFEARRREYESAESELRAAISLVRYFDYPVPQDLIEESPPSKTLAAIS